MIMTKENRAELRTLKKARSKVASECKQCISAINFQSKRLTQAYARQIKLWNREKLLAMKRTAKESAAIDRRIAILQGREA